MPKYRAHFEFDAPDDMTAWLMGQKLARNQRHEPGQAPEFAFVNIESEKRYWGDVPIPDGPGFENVRRARDEKPPDFIPF